MINTLEFCPSEIFVEIFRYLNSLDIYQTFYGLNTRLSALVRIHGVKYIDLTERKFYECEKILSDIDCTEVNTLKLSARHNDEQIDRILDASYFPLSKFHRLRSLTLDFIGLFTFNFISSQISDLHHLESLRIRFRPGLCHEKLARIYQSIIYDYCLRFKSLKSLNLAFGDVNELITDKSLRSTVQSIRKNSCLKSLSIGNLRNENIGSVLSQFPNLVRLNVTLKINQLEFDYPILSTLTFCTLKIYSFRYESLVNLLKSCPNLKQLMLDIDTESNQLVYSDDLENLIETYLSKLKQFRIRTYVPQNIPLDAIIEDFLQNQFWIKRQTKVNINQENATVDEHTSAEIVVEFAI